MRRIGVADTRVIEGGPAGCRPRPVSDKAAWYLPVAITTSLLSVAVPVALLFELTGQPKPELCALAATAVWGGVQTAQRRYERHLLGESRDALAVLRDWLTLCGILAVARIALGEGSAPVVAFFALLPALLLTGTCRWAIHVHLAASRREACAVHKVLVVGEAAAVDLAVDQLAARTDHPYVLVGAVPVGGSTLESGVPEAARLGAEVPDAPGWDAQAVLSAARVQGAGLVLVTPGPRMSGVRLRTLTWALHEAGLPLAVLPGVTEVAHRRMRLSVAGGLALLHIAPPLRRGPQVLLKAAIDRAGAALGLLLLAPVFAVVAAAIRGTSAGPVFHRQTRHGRDCVPFTMWKFRSMVADAESRGGELAAVNEHEGPLFKVRRDPRITRVGSVLRRTSLDELPQLINVLRGEMSLVGPRPPLPEEVARYGEQELRRLAVKPGMTGLWQVSGRSELSWDETLALDLSYVENWSITYDVDVMARTVRAVVDGRGAY